MDILDFDYHLPKELIANSPANPRDSSRLMVIDRITGEITHRHFYNIIDYLNKDDVLVLNKTKVFPARFFGQKNFKEIEVLLINEVKAGVWKALTKPGIKDGQTISFKNKVFKVLEHNEQTVLLKTDLEKTELLNLLYKFGQTPIPPYIKSESSERNLRKEYQTVYAKVEGSVAAPTAGFHFTTELLNKIKEKGIQIEYVTLHVGLGTFAPVKVKKLEDHPMHSEHFEIETNVIERLNKAKKQGKRIVSVGTTTTRTLESLAIENCKLKIENSGSTSLFIYPGYKFKFTDAMITNFHLPKSTLLALVYAFTGTKLMKKAYQEAIKDKYRFYSFGDASLII